MAGEVAGSQCRGVRRGTPSIRRVAAARHRGDGGVEVQGVGEVELGLDEGGAVEGDLVVVEGDVPTLGRLLRILQGLVGHEPGDGLGDEPVELGGADPVGEGCDLGVHESRRLRREGDGGLGDPAGLPGREPTGLAGTVDAALGPRQAVLQLHGVRDQHPPGVGGTSDRGRELRDAELGHCGGTFARQRQLALGAGPARCQRDRLRRVLLGPGHRRQQQVGLGPIGRRARGPREPEHPGRGFEVGR